MQIRRSWIFVFLLLLNLTARGQNLLPLLLGNTNSGTISLPSQVDRFTFFGTAGQRVYLDTFDLDAEDISITVSSPSGRTVWSMNHSTDAGPTYLVESGTYTISVDGGGDTTGDYSFRIIDLSTATAIGYGTVIAGQLSPQSATAAYRFSGTNGQRVNLENIAASAANANWRLVSPAGQNLLGPANISGTLGEAVLPATGTYLVLVEGFSENIGSLDFQFRVSLVSNPTGATSGFGTVRSGTLLLGETNSFAYAGPAGTPVFLDALTNASAVTIGLISPSNEVVFSASGAVDAGPFMLPRSGNYTLTVVATADTEYFFRILDLNASATPITPAVAYARIFDLPSPFRSDIFRFTAAAGQRLYYDALDSDFDNVVLSIYRPDNQFLVFQNADSDNGPFTIHMPGTYYLSLYSQTSDPASDAAFRLLDAAQAPSAVINFDTPVNGPGSPSNGISLYRFAGSAGQRLYFDGASTNASGAWTVYSPGDSALAIAGLNRDFELTLPSDGTYLIAAGNSASSDPFGIRIITPGTTTNALTLGAVVNGALAEPGESDSFTFTGTAGQRLYYDALQNDFQNLTVMLRDPTGGIVHINNNSDSDVAPFTLTTSGAYALELHAPTEVVGAYSFRLMDAAQSPAAPVAFDTTINAALAPGTSALVYRFNGSAGQRLVFDGADTNDAGAWTLYGPANAFLGSSGLNQNFEQLLPVSGQYLLVAGNAPLTNDATLSFRILTPNTTTNTLTLGVTVNGSLDELGESDRYTFTGTAGQRLYFDALQNIIGSFTAQLFDPSGSVVYINGGANTDQGLFTLVEAGVYTLEIHSFSEPPEAYSFRLLDLAAAPVANYGNLIVGQLNPQLQTALYRINGTNGQRIVITNVLASSGSANLFLTGPDNAVLASGNVLSDLGEIFLPATGTYALLVVGTSDGIGAFDFQFRVVLVTGPSGAPSGLGGEESGTTTLDQTNTFTFSGPAGLPIYFDSLTNSSAANVRLRGPNGETIFHVNGSSDSGIHFLPRNGTYTVEVVGLADGNYHFRILDLTAAAASVAFGTTYSQALSPAFSADIYRITATNGQRIYYDGENVFAGFLVFATLYTPSGPVLTGNYTYSDIGPLTLTHPGTYYLVLSSLTTDDTVGYSFRVLDAAQSPVSALTFDTPVTDAVNPGTLANAYRFTGVAGQRLFFNGANTNGAGSWSLFAPDNVNLAGNSLAGDFEVTLPQDGLYLLVAGNSGSVDPFSYAFEVVTPNSTANALAIGVPANGSLDEVGEEDRFTFTGTAGQRLYYDALDAEGDNLRVQLFDPLGNPVFDMGAEQDSDPFTLVLSGTYSLRMKDYGDGTGNYAFRVLDTVTAPTVSYDTVISDSVTNTFGARLYFVPATANLRFIVDGLGAIDGLGVQRLYSRNNTLLSHLAFGQDFEVTPLTADPYLLVLRSGVSTNLPYSFQVIPGNHAPVLGAIGARMVNESNTLAFAATATDLEFPNDQLTFSLDPGAPSGVSIHPTTGAFSWTPGETNGPGIYPITIRVTDDGLPPFNDSETFNVTVNEINVVPTLIVPGNQTINELTPLLNVNASATDPDIPVNPLFFSLLSPPTGMTINANTGAISWTPAENQGPFTNTITVVVTDLNTNAVNAQQLSATNTFTVTVREVNVAPVLTLPPNTNLNELTFYTNNATATDSDLPANNLTFALVSGPSGLTVSPAGAITWTPSEAQGPLTTNVFIRVTDANPSAFNATSLSVTTSFEIVVNEVNVAPVLTLPPSTNINELVFYTNNATATDSDLPANNLTFALVAGPSGLNVSSSGAITWTPTEAQGPLTTNVTIRVTDTNPSAVNAASLSVTSIFQIVVNEVNLAPVLTVPASRTLHAGAALSANATAVDPDIPANSFGFALVSGPPALTVSPGGLVAWTTSLADSGTTNIVTLRVTDTGTPNLSTTNSFVVTVVTTPTITSIHRSGDLVTLVWTSISGTSYRVLFKANIEDAWNDLPGDVPATGPTAMKTDNTLGASPRRFYRISVP